MLWTCPLLAVTLCFIAYMVGGHLEGLSPHTARHGYYLLGDNGILTSYPSGKRQNVKSPDHRRRKRGIINECSTSDIDRSDFIVDLLLLVDVSVYEFFMDADGGDDFIATNHMYPYFSTIVAEVGRIYSNQRFGNFTISGVRNSGIVICKNAIHCPWIQNRTRLKTNANPDKPKVDGEQILARLKDWLKHHRDHMPQYDHAMAVTRYDITRRGDSATQGIGYLESMCRPDESFSAIEDSGAAATVAVAAHELGHSLGAGHDRQKGTDCAASLNFIMRSYLSARPKIVENSFKFSKCSIEEISNYLSRLRQQRHHCLVKSSAPLTQAFGDRGRLPGQHYNADRQCQLIYGPTFRYCTDEDYYTSQMCHRLFCRNAKDGPRSQCITQWYLPAFHGTTCGNKMWCEFGACVENTKAPSVRGCRFGDRDAGFCRRLIRKVPYHCSIPPFSRFCCRSCQNEQKRRRRARLFRHA